MWHTATLRGHVRMENSVALTRRAEFSGKMWEFITRMSVDVPTLNEPQLNSSELEPQLKSLLTSGSAFLVSAPCRTSSHS